MAVSRARNNLTPRSRQDSEQSGDLLYKLAFCQKNDAPISSGVCACSTSPAPSWGCCCHFSRQSPQRQHFLHPGWPTQRMGVQSNLASGLEGHRWGGGWLVPMAGGTCPMVGWAALSGWNESHPPPLASGPALFADHKWRLSFTKSEKKTKPNPSAFKMETFRLLGANRNHCALLVQNICGAAKWAAANVMFHWFLVTQQLMWQFNSE